MFRPDFPGAFYSQSTTMPQQTQTLCWVGDIDGHLRLLDQTQLPTTLAYVDCHSVEDVWKAIRSLQVRGAPAIGIAAAYGVCLAIQQAKHDIKLCAREACEYLATSRPTAVNLSWALDCMRYVLQTECVDNNPRELAERLLGEACAIHQEDRQQCASIGRCGAELLTSLPQGAGILTHCNTGALATGGDGTALAVIFALAQAGADPHVFVDETRPLLQGARLTAWELKQRGIEATLICDSMAAQVMKEGRVAACITGADRIAANGDTANKIGTYGVATLAQAHGIPFYVAAPMSTFDLTLDSGDQIPIEERGANEITCGFGKVTAPDQIAVYNPAFDVTPAELISAIVTERGVIQPVSSQQIANSVVVRERKVEAQ
jgi:methylthioribose-1-phosphate isomerase